MKMIDTTALRNEIQRLDSRYDADFDIVSGGPPVTYIEMKLLETCRRLTDCIDDLNERIKAIENDLDAAHVPHLP